jgi:uridylate kinase
MGGNNKRKRIIISVGGSLIVPTDGIGVEFLKNLNSFVREKLAQDSSRQFFLVTGGGTTARKYIEAGQQVLEHKLTRDDLDWLGIHSSRLNAHLVRTIFRDIAHPYIVKNFDIIRKAEEPVVVAAGWKPGWSTDYCAVLLGQDYGVDTILNLSNVTEVYDKDPKKFEDAKPIKNISWADFRKLVGDEWTPGMNAPFDPIAAKKAQELGVKVAIMSGKDFNNIESYLKGEEFVGTVIK